MKAVNVAKSTVIATTLIEAKGFFQRLKGLIGRTALDEGEGLWMARCRAIHTFGMRFPIDVVFLDKRNIVVAAIKNLPPRRITRLYFNAESVLELPIGRMESTSTEPGDKVEFV